MITCPACGTENADGQKFCGECGAKLEAAPAQETRKTVTIVFCDVTGSTALGERLDPESLRKVITRYFETMRVVLERHGGTVEKFIGDAVMAVFGIPQIREDDALRAVRAAAEMRDALADLNKELERDRGVTIDTRVGVHTGEVMAGDATSGHGFMSGDAGNVAARLEQAAAAGEVLLSVETHSLVRDAVTVEVVAALELKGKAEPFPAFRLLAVHPDVAGHVRHMDAPMVGRERELQLLGQMFDRCITESACFLFTLLGPAGVGKSRLAEEFLRSIAGDATVLRGRCLSYGEGATFFPIAEIVSRAADLNEADGPEQELAKVCALVEDDPDAEQIAASVLQVIGARAEGGFTIQENLWSVRRLFECVAAERPVVLVFDDLEWAEPTLLDLIDHVADLSRGAPILVLCMARPELLDERPSWGGGKFNATSVLLEPLSDAESGTLVRAMLGGADLDERLRGRILEAAKGNPLYVEEVLAMLVENGMLVREERWVATRDVGEIPVPPSVQALLAARLDRLSEPERAALGRASVIGKVFYQGALLELSPEPERAGLAAVLTILVRKGLIRPDRSDIGRQHAYRFHHLLLRDAAYQTLTKEARADLHERFAAWLEEAMGDHADEGMEVIGYHLEQAYLYATQLGPVDDHGREMAAMAADRLGRAGRSARQRMDEPASLALVERAIALLPGDSRERPELLLAAADVLLRRDLELATQRLTEALEAARTLGDELAEGYAAVGLAKARTLTDPEGATGRIQEVVAQWIPRFERLGSDEGLSRAYFTLADVGWFHLQFGSADENLQRSVDHARRAGQRILQFESLLWLCAARYFGPAHRDVLAEAVAEFERLTGGGTASKWNLIHFAADKAALEGRLGDARALIEDAIHFSETVGDLRGQELVEHVIGFAELDGAWADAEVAARRAFQGDIDKGNQAGASTRAAYVAREAAMQGKVDVALEWADQCERLGASDDLLNQALLRQSRALALARDRRFAEAESMAVDAVSMLDATDALPIQADAQLDLAQVLELAAKRDEAKAALRRAQEISERKGDRARHRIATERLAALGTNAPPG